MKRISFFSVLLILVITSCTFSPKQTDNSSIGLDTTVTSSEPPEGGSITLTDTLVPAGTKEKNTVPAKKTPTVTLDTISVH